MHGSSRSGWHRAPTLFVSWHIPSVNFPFTKNVKPLVYNPADLSRRSRWNIHHVADRLARRRDPRMSSGSASFTDTAIHGKLEPPRSLHGVEDAEVIWDTITRRFPNAAPLLCEMETVIERAEDLLQQLRTPCTQGNGMQFLELDGESDFSVHTCITGNLREF